jgi:hypothetical protein
MRIIVAILLLVAIHFNLTTFVPAEAGKAWIGWPFATDTKPLVSVVGGIPSQPGSIISVLVAGTAVLAFLGALLSLFGWIVPSDWWGVLVAVGSAASIVLYILFFSVFSLLPIAIDVILLWGVFLQHWTVSTLSNG